MSVVRAMRKVDITWLDSHEYPGWHCPDEIESVLAFRDSECYTRGYLVVEGKDCILVAHTVGSNGHYIGVTKIPKIAIVKGYNG